VSGPGGFRNLVGRILEHDPDRVAVRRSAVRIGWQVALVSAALVVLIVGLVIGYVIWQSTPSEQLEAHPDTTRIYVDSRDLLLALAVIGAFAVLCAGLATWIVARRAVTPIGEALRMQRTFVADASHELRTPLTVLNARVQQLERRMRDDDENLPVVEALRTDTRALIDIVNDLLESASVDPGAVDTRTAVAPELDAAVRDLQIIADARAIRIEHAPTDAVAAVPAVALRRCLVALVDNAVVHSPDGGLVEVAVVPESRRVRVVVRDHGDGIVGIDPPRVFDRFAHGTVTPDTTHRTGFGIGLALVREIAARYRGTVEVTGSGPDGTTFTLTVPTA
jgi:signal transduction histidine kinase